MPGSNPQARERVMDDEKHLDALASFAPFAGRETSGVSPADSLRGSAVQTPTRASVTKRCSRLRRVGALLYLLVEGSSTRGSRPVPTRQAARKGGGLVIRTARSLALVAAPQGEADEREPERRELTVVLPCDESRMGPAAIRRRRTDRAPARPAGAARNQPFEGSCSRSVRWQKSDERRHRRGCAQHPGDRSGVQKRNAARGNSRGAIDRPADGRRSGSSVLAAIPSRGST